MPRVDSRVSGSTEPFGVEVTYEGEPMVVVGATFELRPLGGSVALTGAGSQPAPGVVVFAPTEEEATLAPGQYEYRFTCDHALDAGGVLKHSWVSVEVEG